MHLTPLLRSHWEEGFTLVACLAVMNRVRKETHGGRDC